VDRSSGAPSPGCKLEEAACNQRRRQGWTEPAVGHLHIRPEVVELHTGLVEGVLVGPSLHVSSILCFVIKHGFRLLCQLK
jgi:hypothetical protein